MELLDRKKEYYYFSFFSFLSFFLFLPSYSQPPSPFHHFTICTIPPFSPLSAASPLINSSLPLCCSRNAVASIEHCSSSVFEVQQSGTLFCSSVINVAGMKQHSLRGFVRCADLYGKARRELAHGRVLSDNYAQGRVGRHTETLSREDVFVSEACFWLSHLKHLVKSPMQCFIVFFSSKY